MTVKPIMMSFQQSLHVQVRVSIHTCTRTDILGVYEIASYYIIYKARRYICIIYRYIYLLPFYWHHGINFNTTFRKNHKRYRTKTFLTGSNALMPSNEHEKSKNWPRNKNLIVPKIWSPKWCQKRELHRQQLFSQLGDFGAGNWSGPSRVLTPVFSLTILIVCFVSD